MSRVIVCRAESRAFFAQHGRDVLDFNEADGTFTFKVVSPDIFDRPDRAPQWNKRNAGSPACTRNSNGYAIVVFMARRVLAHHYVFFLTHGRWPVDQIDHINGDRMDNRPGNLREVDASTNRMNMKRRSNNTSGVTGVMFDQRKRKWIAHICHRKQRKILGSFAAFDDAVKARLAAQKELGFGPAHGAA